jgi:hypothetical protein
MRGQGARPEAVRRQPGDFVPGEAAYLGPSNVPGPGADDPRAWIVMPASRFVRATNRSDRFPMLDRVSKASLPSSPRERPAHGTLVKD